MSVTTTMRAIVCQSDLEDTALVAAELITRATEQLAGEDPRGALLFASTEYDHGALLSALRDRWPGLPLIGGTSDGEMASTGGFRHDSAVLTLLVGDGFQVHVGVGRGLSGDIPGAVAAATAGLAAPARICFTVFAPSTNSSEVVRRLQARLGGARCPVVGGLSGDHGEYGKMVEFFGGEVLRDSLPVMVLTGAVGVGFGIGTGWFPVGAPHAVTSGDGHIVHSIGGAPAIDVYRNFWGSVPESGLGEYPLAVYPEGLEGPFFLRAVLGSDRTTGSIQCAGEVPAGSWIRLTEVLPEGILAGSATAAVAAVDNYDGTRPQVALMFSCAARKWVLGTEAERELGLVQQALLDCGVDAVLAGLYVFGEIAPPGPGAPSDFHNETCVTVLLGE